jgi:hypothetical protein
MRLRSKGRTVALVAALLIAAPLARAQDQPQQPQPPAGAAFPDRLMEGIGNFFRSIFGTGEGELPTPQPDPEDPTAPGNQPPQMQQRPPATGPQEQQAQPQAPESRPQEQPPAAPARPVAQAVPQSLQAAIARGDYGNAVKMIEQGADLEAKDPGAGATALHYAVMKGEMPLVGLLIQRGADINSRTKSGTTPLHTAVLYGRFEVAEYLISKGADVNAKSISGATPLSLADAARFELIAKLLREHGAK